MSKENKYGFKGRTSARLAAVQAVYCLTTTDTPADVLIRQFEDGGIGGFALIDEENGFEQKIDFVPFEKEFFGEVVRGVSSSFEDILKSIEVFLSKEWPISRLEKILKSILVCGAYELSRKQDMPHEIIINEYVDIAHAFYEGVEPKMVNAVLDKMARELRV